MQHRIIKPICHHTATLILSSLLLTVTACSPNHYIIGQGSDQRGDIGTPHHRSTEQNNAEPQLPSGEGGSFKIGTPYKIAGIWYQPIESAEGYSETGIASWYGDEFNGRKTANGETFDMYALSAAHKTLPLPTLARVTNLDNGKSIVVRINDRGPFVKERLIDLSHAAANALGFLDIGTAHVRVEVISEHSPFSSRSRTPLPTASDETEPSRKAHQSAYTTAIKNLGITTASAAPVQPVQEIAMPTTPVANNTPIQTLPQPRPAAPQLIFIQLGAFSSQENALRMRDLFATHHPDIHIQRTNHTPPMFRVRIGPFSNRPQAEQAIVSLEREGIQHAIVVTNE
ncbi:MAG: septal ring lytic transglycosylase RlpA family protein [Zetaproteobacteria bacterium]|nr:septal ring lytic transglycosylase RlpA family protein [Zetaproteobacteria bacterium]